MARHWTINGRFLAQPMTGVQRYAYEVVRALDQLLAESSGSARDLEVELLVPPDAKASLDLAAIRTRTVGRLRRYAWEQAELPAHARGGLISLCNTGPILHRKQILCIHDVNTRTCPRSYAWRFRAAYRVLLPALGRTAHTITTVSAYSAGELARLGIRSRDRIVVAPGGHDHVLRWQPERSARVERAIAPNTIVIIGSPAPHKNSGFLLEMSTRLASAGLCLAIVGAADPRVYNVAEGDPAVGNALWLGRATDGELAALLEGCMCLAFPSLVEGFGLPPLEAMALGCPVVTSDRASMPEICGDAALYASPEDADAWLDRFMELHRSPGLRRQMIARGRARAESFRWKHTAGCYLRAMAEADGVAGPAEICRSPVAVS